MHNNTDGTFLDPDGNPRTPAMVRPAASTRVDTAWPTGEAAGRMAAKVSTHAHREDPR